MSRKKIKIEGEKIYPFRREDVLNFLKVLVNNDSANIDDNKVNDEVNAIIAEQDSDLISKYENAVTSTGNKAGGKKSDRINVKATKKEMAARQVEEKERDEER